MTAMSGLSSYERAASALAIFIFLWSVARSVTRAQRRLPPGPKPLPILGNLLDIPKQEPWKTFREWSKAYGDVIYLTIPTQPTVVLGTARAATELLEKRSHIYSDRPVSEINSVSGCDFNFGFMSYDQTCRDHRRKCHQHFNRGVAPQYLQAQTQSVRRFLRRALGTSGGQSLLGELRFMFAANMMEIIYGLEAHRTDEYLPLLDKALMAIMLSKQPGIPWVDIFPILKRILKWVPGTNIVKTAAAYKPIVAGLRDRPYEEVRKRVSDGTAHLCVATSLIQEQELEDIINDTSKLQREDEIARSITSVCFFSGVDTVATAAQVFMLAMTQYPDVQKKAQAELDNYVGSGRLPEYNDRDGLVYLQAVLLETLRWIPVAPIGLAHRASADDVYNGYTIPKGTVIVPNVWAILHDPEQYPEPESFIPERFIKNGKINPDIRDPSVFAFGFGRRVCPGQYLAEQAIFLFIISTLHVFDITPALDEHGRPHEVGLEMTLIQNLTHFPSTLRLRSEEAGKLIRSIECEATRAPT